MKNFQSRLERVEAELKAMPVHNIYRNFFRNLSMAEFISLCRQKGVPLHDRMARWAKYGGAKEIEEIKNSGRLEKIEAKLKTWSKENSIYRDMGLKEFVKLCRLKGVPLSDEILRRVESVGKEEL